MGKARLEVRKHVTAVCNNACAMYFQTDLSITVLQLGQHASVARASQSPLCRLLTCAAMQGRSSRVGHHSVGRRHAGLVFRTETQQRQAREQNYVSTLQLQVQHLPGGAR